MEDMETTRHCADCALFERDENGTFCDIFGDPRDESDDACDAFERAGVVKKEGWVNIHKNWLTKVDRVVCGIFDSKEEAESMVGCTPGSHIATVKIKWEEEV